MLILVVNRWIMGGDIVDRQKPICLQTCRICLETTDRKDLFCPCDCRGTTKWVHQACLKKWHDSGGNIHRCELCHARFNRVGPNSTVMSRHCVAIMRRDLVRNLHFYTVFHMFTMFLAIESFLSIFNILIFLSIKHRLGPIEKIMAPMSYRTLHQFELVYVVCGDAMAIFVVVVGTIWLLSPPVRSIGYYPVLKAIYAEPGVIASCMFMTMALVAVCTVGLSFLQGIFITLFVAILVRSRIKIDKHILVDSLNRNKLGKIAGEFLQDEWTERQEREKDTPIQIV